MDPEAQKQRKLKEKSSPEKQKRPEQQPNAERELLEDVLADLLDRDPDEAKKYIEGYRQVEGQ
jgi:hypothetical protein